MKSCHLNGEQSIEITIAEDLHGSRSSLNKEGVGHFELLGLFTSLSDYLLSFEFNDIVAVIEVYLSFDDLAIVNSIQQSLFFLGSDVQFQLIDDGFSNLLFLFFPFLLSLLPGNDSLLLLL